MSMVLRALWMTLGLAAIAAAVVWLSGGFEARIAPGRPRPLTRTGACCIAAPCPNA